MRNTIIEEARDAINGDRQESYGSAKESFERIAEFWTTYSGHNISALDVAAMMELLKIARNAASPGHRDSYVDRIGYAALGAELALEET